jgi:hypothetical protein
MRIEGINTGGTGLVLNAPRPVTRGSTGEANAAKSLGESPPIVLDLKNIGELAAFFGPTGRLGRLRKKLNYLKRKNCVLVPAEGDNACVDDEDVVYVGVGLLKQYQNDEETLAGVLAHEWGHACAMKPGRGEIQKLNWDQIFELRRAHETLADETCGRLLLRMGYKTDGIIKFLMRGKDTHNLKYHHPEIRSQIIRYGFTSEHRKALLARRLFKNNGYKGEYDSILLDIA